MLSLYFVLLLQISRLMYMWDKITVVFKLCFQTEYENAEVNGVSVTSSPVVYATCPTGMFFFNRN